MLVNGFCMRHYIDIVETEIGKAEAGEEFKCLIQFMVSARLVDRATVPWTVERACAKYVKTIPAECMPIANRHPQMFGHRLAHDNAVLVIITVS